LDETPIRYHSFDFLLIKAEIGFNGSIVRRKRCCGVLASFLLPFLAPEIDEFHSSDQRPLKSGNSHMYAGRNSI